MLTYSLCLCVNLPPPPPPPGELCSFGTCPLIEVLNCQRCTGLKGTLDMLVTCTRLQVLNIEGTAVKGELDSAIVR
jgi:hypothetical protein